jgi:hypothetical protein
MKINFMSLCTTLHKIWQHKIVLIIIEIWKYIHLDVSTNKLLIISSIYSNFKFVEIIGQYREREAHQISIPMQITSFGGLTFERLEYSKHSIL